MTWFWTWLLVLGGVTLVGGVLAGRMHPGDARPPLSLARVGAGLLLALIAFALCLPGRFPFSRGLELGYGVLIGLGAAILAVVGRCLARPSDSYAVLAASAAAAGGAAIAGIAFAEIAFRGNPGYAVLGVLAGGLLAILPVAWERDEPETRAFAGALLIAGLGALLAIGRYPLASERLYWPLPAAPLAAGLLALALGALLFGRLALARWATPALVILLEAGACLAARALIHRQEHISLPPRFGSLLLLAWAAFLLIASITRPERGNAFSRIAAALLAVIAPIIAFNIAGGYGSAIMLGAALPLALALWRGEAGSAPLWAVALGVLFLAYRLYLAHFQYDFRFGQTVEFGRHYVFLGLAAGILWLGSARHFRVSGASVAQLAALVFLPVVLFVVFGYEANLGLLLGLWLAHFSLPLWGEAEAPGEGLGGWDWRAVPNLFLPLVAVWSLIIPNWAEFMLDQPRWIRGLVVGAAAALVLVVLALMRARGPSLATQATEPARR